ncbi:MAG: C4-type zinc ribbon domain-containing protein [Actinomycetota bacterium]|nr:C4-type zinc ribbon domain-containing protein [Actinomycetota bacterium]
MKADPHAQWRLLDVQELDSRIDRLTHRRRSLPELAEITDLRKQRDEAAADVVVAQTEVDDLAREQRKADADVEQVKSRRARDQRRLDQGQVGSPKELQNLQHEIETLERRISDLEDAELDVMERLETAQAQLDQLQASIGEYDEGLRELEKRRDAATSEIDAEVREAESERGQIVAGLPDDLLKLYERLRGSHGGVGAAALVQRRCQGCRLELNAADLREIAAAPEDEVLRCEECQRILVRTAESGI